MIVRMVVGGSMVVVLASMMATKAAAASGPSLTPDQQSLVQLTARTQLTSHGHKWTPRTPLCFRIELRDSEGNSRQAQAPAEVLRSLNAGGRKVFAAEQCLTHVSKDGDGEKTFHYSDPNGKPAYLLRIEIPETLGNTGVSVEVNLQQIDCAPLGCDEIDAYTAKKTKQRWTLAYVGWGAE